MSEVHRREVTVQNEQGLHLRPADLFVKCAREFSADIELIRDTLRVDGKSILDIATLGAAQGSTLIIEAQGEDAAQAIHALADLVERRLVEEERARNEKLEQGNAG